MKSAFEQIRVLLELKEKGSISEEEFKQMLAILENESSKNTKDSVIKEESLKEISLVEEYKEYVQEIAGKTEDVNRAPIKTQEEQSNPKPEVQEKSTKIDALNEETKPAVEEDAQTDWVELNSSNTIPFSKKLTRKQWVLIVLGLFFLSFISKRPNIIWDKDSDDVYNWSDICPDKAGSVKCYGCPDKDNDGTTDNLDLNISDQDHDHIPDINDKCPDVWGPLENKGCPSSRQIPKRNRIKKDISQGTSIDKSQSNNSSNNGSIAFPSSKLNEAKLALNDLKFVSNLNKKQKNDLALKIKEICANYFNGVIEGKYKEDSDTQKKLKEIQIQLEKEELKNKSTKIEFPRISEVKIIWDKIENLWDIEQNKKEFKKFSAQYFDGVLTGKYRDDKEFNFFLEKCLRKIDYY